MTKNPDRTLIVNGEHILYMLTMTRVRDKTTVSEAEEKTCHNE